MAARVLRDAGAQVVVFEKSRAPGGRAATRRDAAFRFDHGAQYFTQRDSRTAALLAEWVGAGVAAPWRARLVAREQGRWRDVDTREPRWVGVPGMRALGEHLAVPADVRYGTTVTALERSGQDWVLRDAEGAALGEFAQVLVCIPPAQAGTLLSAHAPAFGASLGAVEMRPCIAALAVLARRPDVPWDGAFVNDGDVLSWVARDASKPGRPPHECWVLHATPAWSASHLEHDPATLVAPLVSALHALLGDTVPVLQAVAHRWRYAIPATDGNTPAPGAATGDVRAETRVEALYDAALGLGAAGDWCVGGRVEGALLSGAALAERVLAAEPITPHGAA